MTRFSHLPKGYEDQEDKLKRDKKKADGSFTFTVPGELPTMNEIIDGSKAHWGSFKQIKDDTEAKIKFCAENQNVPFFEQVFFQITYYRKNKRYDPDNIAAGKKFILDALQKAGIIKNDGWKTVKGFFEKWEVDKENPRTVITIRQPSNVSINDWLDEGE